MPQQQKDNTITRRSSLATMAGAALASAKPVMADLRDKARKNLKLAVFTSVYSALPLEEAVRRIKADGFSAVVPQFTFADIQFDPMSPDWTAADKIVTSFDRLGLKIAGLFGYYNVVDPNPDRRAQGEARMRFLIANWKRLGSPIVCTETGTLNRQSEWLESPENATEDAFEQCRSALGGLVKLAERTGAVVAIEPYWRNVIDSAERAARLFREVQSPSLKLVMDPCNYYRNTDLERVRPVLENIFKRVGSHTVLAHAKDVKASPNGTDLPAAGRGVLDYPLYLKLLTQLDKEIYLAIEHLKIDDVPRARDYVLSQFGKI